MMDIFNAITNMFVALFWLVIALWPLWVTLAVFKSMGWI